MKAKKVISCLTAAALTFSVLAGCGADTAKDNSSNAGESSNTSESSTDQVQSEDIVLTVYQGTAGYAEMVEQICKDYKEETGVTLEWEIPGDEPYTVLKARFASGEAPDIIDLGCGDYDTWYERCMDLSGEVWTEHVYEASLDGGSYDGKVYGLPYAMEGSGIIYNKDLFEQAGIEKVPETISELKETCEKLQAADIQAFGEAWGDWGFLMHILGIPFTYEGALETSERLSAKEETFSNMKYMESFFDFYDLTLEYGWGAESIGHHFDDQINSFVKGEIAMVKQGTWYTDALLSVNPDMNIGLFAVPLTDDPSQTKLQVSTTRFLSISNTSKHEEEAKAFLQWFVDNAQKYMVEKMRIAAPYDTLDLSDIGALNMDMNQYMADGMSYDGFGIEEWPSGFNTDQAEPLQAYAAGAADREATCRALQELWDGRVASSSVKE